MFLAAIPALEVTGSLAWIPKDRRTLAIYEAAVRHDRWATRFILASLREKNPQAYKRLLEAAVRTFPMYAFTEVTGQNLLEHDPELYKSLATLAVSLDPCASHPLDARLLTSDPDFYKSVHRSAVAAGPTGYFFPDGLYDREPHFVSDLCETLVKAGGNLFMRYCPKRLAKDNPSLFQRLVIASFKQEGLQVLEDLSDEQLTPEILAAAEKWVDREDGAARRVAREYYAIALARLQHKLDSVYAPGQPLPGDDSDGGSTPPERSSLRKRR
jgi:hypothetical protein